MNEKTQEEIRNSEVIHKPITLFIDPALHNAMKDLAKRKRVHIGFCYEQAIEMFIDTVNNYRGKSDKKNAS